jgi:GH24 family phage-related lysozyme (muramidase)
VTDSLLDQIVSRLLDFEGSCTWMYRDTNPAGIVTCGAGHALFSADAAILLPWRMGTEHALPGQVRADYLAVQLAPRGLTASPYASLSACRMLDGDVRGLCRLDLISRLFTLRKTLPDLDFYPDGAQEAIADMCFNLGPRFAANGSWPALTAAVLANNWPEAARQCHRRGISEARNKATRDLFLSAVGVAA